MAPFLHLSRMALQGALLVALMPYSVDMSRFFARHNILNELAFGIPYNPVRQIVTQKVDELSEDCIE